VPVPSASAIAKWRRALATWRTSGKRRITRNGAILIATKRAGSARLALLPGASVQLPAIATVEAAAVAHPMLAVVTRAKNFRTIQTVDGEAVAMDERTVPNQ